MEKNIGKTDKIIRLVFGVVFLVAAYWVQSTVAKWVLGILGVMMFVTVAMSFCGFYTLFGVNTCAVKKK